MPAGHDIDVTNGEAHQRATHQRPHPGSRGAVGRPERRAGRHRPRRGRAAPCRRGRPRPRRGGTDGEAAGRQAHGLRQVQVRSRHEGTRSTQEPGQHGHQGDQAPPEDRPARLRHQEGPRRAVPQGWRQGQGDDHVPRSGAVPPRARVPAAPAPRRGRPRARHRRVGPQAGRSQHGDGHRTDQEEGPGHGRAASQARRVRRRRPRHRAGRRRDRRDRPTSAPSSTPRTSRPRAPRPRSPRPTRRPTPRPPPDRRPPNASTTETHTRRSAPCRRTRRTAAPRSASG